MLIPALDLIDGRVVRLFQGDFAQKTEYPLDPVQQAQAYKAAGAEWLHLVDLDGAKDPAKRQQALLKEITQQSGLRCQAGGGIRTQQDLDDLFAAGIERVVIGSTAVNQPDRVRHWFTEYGTDAIVLALDVNIADDGKPWSQRTAAAERELTLDDVLNRFLDVLSLCTLYRYRQRRHLSGTNVALYQRYKALYPQIQWQASGGVSNLQDLIDLKRVNCDSAILGKSLLTGQFELQEAIACWQNA